MAASTSRVYGSGLNQYLAFCREVGIPHPFPLHEFVLELFVALRGTRLSLATLRTYLARPQLFSFRFGFPTKVAGMLSLGFVLRGLRRSQADRFTRPPRRPITVTTLILLRAYIHRRFPARDAVMLLAAIFSAFFGLLSSAEYCSPSPRRFDPVVHLQYHGTAGWRVCASRRRRRIPFGGGGGGVGWSVRLCRTGSALCPFTALHQLLGTHPTFVGPLFAFQDASYLTRARLGHILRGGGGGGGLSFLLRPEHPHLPHRGRVRRGGHGFLLGHDQGPPAVEGRLLQALRPAPRQVRVPRPATHAEVFGVTRGGQACGGAVAPGGWLSCNLLVISALGSSSFFSSPPLLRPWRSSLTGVLHGTSITKTPRLLRIPIAPPVSGLPYIGLGSFRWSSPGARLTKSDLIISPSEYGSQFSFSAKTLWRCTPPPPTPYRGTATEAPSLASYCGFGGGGGGGCGRLTAV